MSARFYFAWKMLATAEIQDQRNCSAKVEAKARASSDPLEDLTDQEFEDKYHLTKKVFRFLCKELRRRTNLRSSQRVAMEQKVLTALFFFASGSYQRSVGDAKNVSQKTCSTFIEQVTQALVHKNMLNKYIKFPSSPAARQALSQRFLSKYGMPGVVGCIDGSHFRIVVPLRDEQHEFFSCHNKYYSINVQMVCDDEHRILSVNPRFGGANDDSFIWETSNLNCYMESLHQNEEMVWLIGDPGYPQRPWLMTPISDAPPNSPEAHYNEIHSKIRLLIQNTFTRMRNRWRCLHKTNVLHYRAEKCARIILACSVLHNLCIDFNLEDGEADQGQKLEDTEEEHTEEEEEPEDLIRGRLLRSELIGRLQ